MPTSLHRLSKSDAVLLLDALADDLFVDNSEQRTSLADNTTYISEGPSARAAIAAPRNIAIVCNMASDSTGTLLQLGTAAVYSYRITVSAGVISVAEAGVTRASLDVPEMGKAGFKVLIHWSTRVEGSSVVSELAVYNFTAATWAFTAATHASATPDATHTLTIGAGVGGASFSAGIGNILAAHVGRRFHATTEAAGDWIGDPTPPSFDGRDRSPLATGPADELAIAGEGSFAGPSLLWAGAATRQATARGVGPLVNARPRTPATEYNTSYPARFYRATPDGAAGWQWCVRYLWHGYLSPQVGVARVRAHLRCFDVFGGEAISPLRFRAFSAADLLSPGLTYQRGPIVSVTAPAEGWSDLGVVRLERDDAGLSYFVLAFKLDATEDEGVIYSSTWQMNALTVEPYSKSLAGGGVGDAEGA